jgi:hypothetical protein
MGERLPHLPELNFLFQGQQIKGGMVIAGKNPVHSFQRDLTSRASNGARRDSFASVMSFLY